MRTIGFLHTSPVHTERFGALVEHLSPGTPTVTLVDEGLLQSARRSGPDHPSVLAQIEVALDQLEREGADVVVCTCSTIGEPTEQLGSRRGQRVIRIDRPMLEAAVDAGARIAVVAAVESTVLPTRRLIESIAAARGRQVEISLVISEGAWERFEAGDQEGYLQAVAETCSLLDGTADVIVLAQASMADAVGLIATATPVLASPHLAVAAALSAGVRDRRS
jgi:hypothetical protein